MNRRAHLHRRVRSALDERDAVAFVHVGPARAPGLTYCIRAVRQSAKSSPSGSDEPIDDDSTGETGSTGGHLSIESDPVAVAFTADSTCAYGPGPVDNRHPAAHLATTLSDRLDAGTVLAPSSIAHDGALYLENAGFTLASSALLERARASKTPREIERIEYTQRAATAGIERAFEVLSEAESSGDGLEYNGEMLSSSTLRTEIGEEIVAAGGFPDGNTIVFTDGEAGASANERILRAAVPVTIAVGPRDRCGYYGGLTRTVVIEGEGGWERRAHVGLTHAFKSTRALCSTDAATVEGVEADLKAEVQAFGFASGIETSVHGVGLEARERPDSRSVDASDRSETEAGESATPIPVGSVLRVEVAVTGADTADRTGVIRLGDLLLRTEEDARWLAGPSRSLDPRSPPSNSE